MKWLPWDVRLALLAALIVLFAEIYESAPMIAVFLYLVLASVVVVMTVNDETNL